MEGWRDWVAIALIVLGSVGATIAFFALCRIFQRDYGPNASRPPVRNPRV